MRQPFQLEPGIFLVQASFCKLSLISLCLNYFASSDPHHDILFDIPCWQFVWHTVSSDILSGILCGTWGPALPTAMKSLEEAEEKAESAALFKSHNPHLVGEKMENIIDLSCPTGFLQESSSGLAWLWPAKNAGRSGHFSPRKPPGAAR